MAEYPNNFRTSPREITGRDYIVDGGEYDWYENRFPGDPGEHVLDFYFTSLLPRCILSDVARRHNVENSEKRLPFLWQN